MLCMLLKEVLDMRKQGIAFGKLVTAPLFAILFQIQSRNPEGKLEVNNFMTLRLTFFRVAISKR